MSMDAINHSDSSQLTECQVEKQLQPIIYIESPSSDDATDEEHTSWVAWMIVAIGTMINTSCAFAWMTASCTPIDSSVYFGIDLTALNWLSNTSAILNSVVSLPAAWCYEHLGLKKSIILSAVLNAAGCWIRCLAIIVPENSRYAPMMAGQVLSSIGAPLIYNIGARMASIWFGSKDRPLANMLLTIPLGMVLSPLILPRIVDSPDDIPRMLLIIAGMSTVSCLPTLFIPAWPARPPTKSSKEARISVLQSLKELIRHRQFMCLALIASVNQGMGGAISVLIPQAILPLGYTDDQAGLCSAILVAAGFAGGFASSYFAGKTAQHLMLIKVFAPLILFSYVTFPFLILPNAFGAILIACIVNGYTVFGIMPVMIEYGCEILYPVSESVTSCFIWTWVTAFMLIFSVMIDALRAGPDANPPYNMNHSMIAVAVVAAVCMVPVLWLKGEMRRTAVDRSKPSSPDVYLIN